MGIVNICDLKKTFADVTAVNGVSLEVGAGDIHGILGPNGAGKSTTINCMLGLLSIDGGSVTFENGLTIAKWRKKHRLYTAGSCGLSRTYSRGECKVLLFSVWLRWA